MSFAREEIEEISEGKYIKYSSINNVDNMRLKVRDDLVPNRDRKDWLGCKVVKENNSFYVKHMFRKEWINK